MKGKNAQKHDLVVGASGQDGYYLSKYLETKDRLVLKLDKDGFINSNGHLKACDICNPMDVDQLFKNYNIDRVFYLAAFHHSGEQETANNPEILEKSMQIHVHAFDHFLNAISKFNPTCKIFYAASSHLFAGHAKSSADREILINEYTPISPIGFYAQSKAKGVELVDKARTEGLFAVAGYLFNHESSRRPKSFLINKLTHGALDCFLDNSRTIELLDLAARVDWGYAPDYVRAMHLTLTQDTAQNFVIATGKLHSVAEYAEQLFSILGLDWRNHVREKKDAKGKTESATSLAGSCERLQKATGWKPNTSFNEMVAYILHDIAEERGIQLTNNLKGVQHAF